MNNKLIPEQLAYLAGIIDKAGTITIEIQSKGIGNNRRCDYYSLRLLITDTNLTLLRWIEFSFGGTIRPIKTLADRRPVYRWNLCSYNAAQVLKACESYIVAKKDQIKIFLEFASTMTKSNNGLSDELIEHRKNLYLKLKHIKKTY